MKYIIKAALIMSGLLLAIYIARNEIISFYFCNLHTYSKPYRIKIIDPYVSLIPPFMEFKELEIYDFKNKKTFFLIERFKLEAEWDFYKNWKINKISGHIRQWHITRDASGKTNLDWISAIAEKYNQSFKIDEVHLSARGVIFTDYVFSEDGLTIKQPSDSVESITLYSISGNAAQLAAWIFPKLWFDMPFTIKNIASASRPVPHLRLQKHTVSIYADQGN